MHSDWPCPILPVTLSSLTQDFPLFSFLPGHPDMACNNLHYLGHVKHVSDVNVNLYSASSQKNASNDESTCAEAVHYINNINFRQNCSNNDRKTQIQESVCKSTRQQSTFMTSANLKCSDCFVAHVDVAFNENIWNSILLQRTTNHVQHFVPLQTVDTAAVLKFPQCLLYFNQISTPYVLSR